MATNETRRRVYEVISAMITAGVANAMFLTEEKFFALEIAEQFRATAEMMKNNPVADVPESSLVTEVREKAESEGPTETQIVELVLQLKKYEFVFVEKNLAEQSYYDRLSKMVKMMPGYGT